MSGFWNNTRIPDQPSGRSPVTDAWRREILERFAEDRLIIRRLVPLWFPVGMRVAVPKRHGGTAGVVDGYHGSEVDAVWVVLDVPEGSGTRRALVPAAELVDCNRG